MTASPEFTSWLKEHHHPELTYWEVWQAGHADLADEIYNKCIGRDFAHLPIIDAILAVREYERKAAVEEILEIVDDVHMEHENHIDKTCGIIATAIRERFA